MKSNFSIDGIMFQQKSNGAGLVSHGVNASIQFPPEILPHRWGLKGKMCVWFEIHTLICTYVKMAFATRTVPLSSSCHILRCSLYILIYTIFSLAFLSIKNTTWCCQIPNIVIPNICWNFFLNLRFITIVYYFSRFSEDCTGDLPMNHWAHTGVSLQVSSPRYQILVLIF